MQSKFTKYIRESGYNKSAAWELKLCKGGNALSYSAFQPQQIPSLLKAKKECIYRKISDADMGLKPYDASQICSAEAYVVAGWHHMMQGISCYWIDVEAFIAEQQQSTRKSLTEQRASEIAQKKHIL